MPSSRTPPPPPLARPPPQQGPSRFAPRNPGHANAQLPAKRPYGREEDDHEDVPEPRNGFVTARKQLEIAQRKRRGLGASNGSGGSGADRGAEGEGARGRRRLGVNRRALPPIQQSHNSDAPQGAGCSGLRKRRPLHGNAGGASNSNAASPDLPPELVEDERMRGIDPKMTELICNEIIDRSPSVSLEDIAGLTFAKKCVSETVFWPLKRPDLFTGLRGPPKGLLLFGPPGTGKTLICKAIASSSETTFFSISASSLMSKWIGEGEKMVRALFAVASVYQPSIIFIDEIDSLLTQRSDTEMEATRRIKTEFLIRLDGTQTSSQDRVLVIGATNRPQELDEAARRRFVKRLYIDLPDPPARAHLFRLLLKNQHSLTGVDLDRIVERSDGYSGSDIHALCQQAAMGPLRSLGDNLENIDANEVRLINMDDFEVAFKQVRASVDTKDLATLEDWNRRFGSFSEQQQ